MVKRHVDWVFRPRALFGDNIRIGKWERRIMNKPPKASPPAFKILTLLAGISLGAGYGLGIEAYPLGAIS
jgi:hypothetical protein